MEEEYEYGNEEMALAESDAFSNVGQGLQGRSKLQLVEYWQQAIDNIERIGDHQEGGQSSQDCFKTTALPLARIKKVMKTDSEVKMISAEAPILFAKGCDIFITELTMRAWIHAEESKRRTLQRSDIATALQKSDMFDFLIDIVPREEAQPRRFPEHGPQGEEFTAGGDPSGDPSEISKDREATPSSVAPSVTEGPEGPSISDGPISADSDSIAEGPIINGPSTSASAGTVSTSPAAPEPPAAAAQGPEYQSPYQLQEFDDVKLERQYDEFEYQSYEQVDV